MKKRSIGYFITLLCLAVGLVGCQREEEETVRPRLSTWARRGLFDAVQKRLDERVAVDSLTTMAVEQIKEMTTGDHIKSQLSYDVAVYRVLYPTTDYQGQEVLASGAVLLPVLPKGFLAHSIEEDGKRFPVLSYQHGTLFGDREVLNNATNDYAYLTASSGYITLVPDYLGFNQSKEMQHPYFNNTCSANAVIDLISTGVGVAADKGRDNNGKLFLFGFSQGGNATLATTKALEAQPLEGLELVATAAGSGAFALREEARYLFAKYSQHDPMATTLLAYMVYGYEKNVARRNSLSYYFNEPYASQVPIHFGGIASVAFCLQTMATAMSTSPAVFNPFFVWAVTNGREVEFNRFLDDNDLSNWGPQTKLRLYHGSTDDLIPQENTLHTYDNMINLYGAKELSLRIVSSTDHGATEKPMLADALAWFAPLK
jgi:dienelactone hydrolase